MLAAAGGVAGLQIAVWATEVLRAYLGRRGRLLNLDLSLDPRIALIGLGVALFTGVATGIAPALQSTRPDMALAMKEGTSGAGRPRSIVREGLIVVQVALSVLLLGAGGLLVRSFFMLHRGPGFDPDRVAIVRLRPSLVGFTNDRAWAYQRDVIERLEALPGVLAASPAGVPPLPGWSRPVTPVRLPGDSADPSQAYLVGTTLVGPRYFKTLGVGVVEGREFDDRDTMDGPRVAVVNETLARHVWPNGGAVGSVMTVGPNRVEVVGVVKDLQWIQRAAATGPGCVPEFLAAGPKQLVVARIRGPTSASRAMRTRCCPRSNVRSPRSIPTCLSRTRGRSARASTLISPPCAPRARCS